MYIFMDRCIFVCISSPLLFAINLYYQVLQINDFVTISWQVLCLDRILKGHRSWTATVTVAINSLWYYVWARQLPNLV